MSADSKMPDFNEELRYGASYSNKLSASRQLRLTNAELNLNITKSLAVETF
jgi:hypothetical protein